MFIWIASHFLRTLFSAQPNRGADQQNYYELDMGAAGEQTPLLIHSVHVWFFTPNRQY